MWFSDASHCSEMYLFPVHHRRLMCLQHHILISPLPPPLLPHPAVPSPPRSVISNVNETSLVLEWSDPRESGGRDDIFYNVICKKCLPERGMCSRCDDNVEISPRHLGLVQRRVAVRNLQAHTQYSFEIQAVNGVSNKSPYAAQFSAVNITTNQAGTSQTAG